MTEHYSDLGGGCPDRWEGVIANRCPTCGAEPNQKCWNTITNTAKRIACLKRLKVTA